MPRGPRGDRQQAFAAVKHGWLPGAGLAISGGHDSTALLLLAAEARNAGKLPPFIALHVDHAVRADSAADAAFVADLCRQLSVPLVVTRLAWDVDPATANEEMLRTQRYAALARLVTRLSLVGIVTAHTRDDQVETILMRLLEGASPIGAAGMEPNTLLDTSAAHRDLYVARPLLGVSRRALDAVLASHGVTPRDDPTNLDTRHRRNALRHAILPAIAAAFPGFEDALLRSAELARRDEAVLFDLASDAERRVVRQQGAAIRIDRRWLREAPAALATRVLQSALHTAGVTFRDPRALTFERVEALRRAAGGRTRARIELPNGVCAAVETEEIVIHCVARVGKD